MTAAAAGWCSRSRRPLVAAAFVVALPAGARHHAAAELAAAAGAVTSAGAERATQAFAARDGDAARTTRRSTSPGRRRRRSSRWVEGANFFPRIFADVEAARSSVHILMFGWREGEVGMRMAALLERKLADGVEVRVIVDGFGSQALRQAREMFTRLAAAGAQIVVNDVFPPDRDGLFPDDQQLDWRQDEVGRADHRKLYVIDGAVAWTGGAGHRGPLRERRLPRRDGARHRRRRAAGAGGVPDELPRPRRRRCRPTCPRYFPEPAEPGSTPIALAQVIPGGFVAASQAIREQIDAARERLDVMNPYLTDGDMIERILAAARRGVKVRVVVSEKSNNAPGDGRALRHRYADLLARGRRGVGAPGHGRPRQGRGRRRRRQLRHGQPRRVGALPQLGDR